jgi:hypothetical protein
MFCLPYHLFPALNHPTSNRFYCKAITCRRLVTFNLLICFLCFHLFSACALYTFRSLTQTVSLIFRYINDENRFAPRESLNIREIRLTFNLILCMLAFFCIPSTPSDHQDSLVSHSMRNDFQIILQTLINIHEARNLFQ